MVGAPAWIPGGGLQLVVVPGRADGARAGLEQLRVRLDGDEVPFEREPLLGGSGRSTDDGRAPINHPAVSVGLVYFWGEGAPPEILEAVPRLLRPVPAATPVHPVPYGEGVPAFVAPRTAADLRGGELDLVAPIVGARPVLGRAVEAAVAALATERSALSFLFVITDGVDHEILDRQAFFQLGQELHRRAIALTVVWFPPSALDERAHDNAAMLAAGAAGRFLAAPSRGALTTYLEGAGLGLLDAQLLTVRPGARLSAGAAEVAISAVVDGVAVGANTQVWLPGSSSRLWLVGAAVILLLAGLLAWGAWRARAADDHTRETIGAVPEDADDEEQDDSASRSHGDRDRGSGRGGAGEAERREARVALEQPADAVAVALAAVVGQAVAGAVVVLRARLGEETVRALAAWSFAETAAFLRRSARRYPDLGSRAGRQWLLALQDALAEDGGGAVAWVVRVGGAGTIGETVRLGAATALARGSSIVAEGGAFVLIAPGQRRPLRDGDTFSAGADRYVFKSVA